MIDKLSDSELHSKMMTLVQQERTLLHEILLHIAEVDRRKLYLSMAFPSLWEYMRSLGYSESSAQRRIDAARLLNKAPEVAQKIEEGTINLSQAAKLGSLAKNNPTKITQAIELIENKSGKETEVILAQVFELPIQTQEKQKAQADESIRLEITLTKEQFDKLKEVQGLISHALPDQNLASVIDYLATQKLNKYQKSTAAAEVIRKRDQCCQYIDPKTKKQCGSRYFLQKDHIKPRWAGGADKPENIRILCGAHNRYRYRTGSGIIKTKSP